MQNLRNSANKASNDAYDFSVSLTGYEPNFMAFSELNDSSGSFSYKTPSSDQARCPRTLRCVCSFLWQANIVLTCTFWRVDPALTRYSNHRLWIGVFRSSGQALFATFRVCRIVFHPVGDPGSALLCVVVRSPGTPCSAMSLRTQTPSSS